jgi:hypothetical protein
VRRKIIVLIGAASLLLPLPACGPCHTNHSPEIISAAVTTAIEDQVYSYDVEATDRNSGDELIFSLNKAPLGMAIDATTGLIEWTPENSLVGDHGVIVRVKDRKEKGKGLSDTQSFTLTVLNVNDPPELAAVTPAEDDADRHDVATEDQKYRYTVEATDPDVGDKLTFSLDEAPDGMSIDPVTGGIEWTPTNDNVGENSVTVRVNDRDGLSDTLTFEVTVANVNDPPEITSAPVTNATENQEYKYDGEATDPDVGDQLTFSLDEAPDGMSIDPVTGVIEWTPTNDNVGENNVVVQVEDKEGLSGTQSFKITVTNVNEPPKITSTAITTAIDNEQYNYDVEATDPDVGDELFFSLVDLPDGMTIDKTSGLIQWTPTSDDLGQHLVTVRVEDPGGLSDTQSFTITVGQVNHAPEITSTPVIIATQDELYSYDVEATDPDEDDADELEFSLYESPDGMIIDPSTGEIQWTPSAYQVGIVDVVVRVKDSGGLFNIQPFTVTVENINDPPEITSDPVTTATQGQEYIYLVEATDPDEDDVDQLTYSLIGTPPVGMTINADGLIEWTPSASQVGDNEVTIRVEDPGELSGTQTFTITTADAIENKYAVIVGISDYSDPAVDDLNYCDEDASSWYYHLYNEGYTCWVYGDNNPSSYPEYDGIASEDNVRNAIRNMVELADGTDKIAFVFSGHGGAYEDWDSFIALWDFTGGGSGEYRDYELEADFADCWAAQLFIFLDTCSAGGMNEVVDSDLHSINHVYMTTTCTGNEEAWGYEMLEGDPEHSAWTYYFLIWGLEGSGHRSWDMATCHGQALDEYHTYYDNNIIDIIGGDWWHVDHPMQFNTQLGTLFYL